MAANRSETPSASQAAPAPPGGWFTRLRGLRPGGTASLSRQLLLWLLLPQLVLWGAAAWITYNIAARYTNAAIDASLSQATRSLARQVKPVGNGLLIDFPRAAQDIIEADPNDRVYYMVSSPPGDFILGNRTLPPPPPDPDPVLGEPRFYDGTMAVGPQAAAVQIPVRVAAMTVAYGDDASAMQTMLVQIARSRASREELAGEILRDIALPLSGLIVLMTIIVWGGIRAGLAPLARLRSQVEDRGANDLAPLPIDDAPIEVRSLARAMNTLLAAVQQNVQTQKRFINDAAHQLRTPLAGLKSQSELAVQDLAYARRHQESAAMEVLQRRLGRVRESAERSAHLINQLLVLARAEPESATVQARVRFDLGRLAGDVTAELVPRALQAGVDLGFDDGAGHEPDAAPATEAAAPSPDAPEALPVTGIPLLLREALSNVVDNAIRYAGRGSMVTVRARRMGAEAWIEVEDNGPGISGPDPERVFDRFVRATHQGTGCGLGLAIVKDVIERHAGRVTLNPVQPHGLRVSIRLPCAD